MTREQLIEQAAKAIYLQRNGHGGTPWEKINTQHREPYRKDVRAVLTAIEAAGLCIVPLEATGEMQADGRDALLAYAGTPVGDSQGGGGRKVVVMRTKPDYREVKNVVADILDEYGIEMPPVNPVSIARDKGIDVYFVSFSGDYKGVSGLYNPKDNAILINKEENPLRQTFTIAHELGHALLHKDWVKSNDYKIYWRDMDRNDLEDIHEKEANAFAANLLVPRKLLNRYVGRVKESDLSRLFAVSNNVIRNRLSLEYGN